MTVVLQSLGCYVDHPTAMVDACILPQLVAAVGSESMFGFLVGGVLVAGLWLAGDGDLATPAVVVVLLGGVLLPTLAADHREIALAFVFVGTAAMIVAAIEKYYLEGAQ